jgi:tagatose-1,6-bisphosphate aldolase non-catalytic subunit AgaZ/GatZ
MAGVVREVVGGPAGLAASTDIHLDGSMRSDKAIELIPDHVAARARRLLAR